MRNGIVIDHQQRDIESCWRDVSGSIDGWRGAKLYWTSGDLNGIYSCFFDSAFPGGGLQIQKYEKLSYQRTRKRQAMCAAANGFVPVAELEFGEMTPHSR